MAREPVTTFVFRVDRDGDSFFVKPTEAPSPFMERAAAVLTEDERAVAEALVAQAADLLGQYAFRTLHPDMVDNRVLVEGPPSVRS